ncbi:hypothetical protein ACROYT_G019783 [Oculina patagonica]
MLLVMSMKLLALSATADSKSNQRRQLAPPYWVHQGNAAMVVAYDHVNYARYLPVYLIQLSETHLEAQMMSENGDFGVQWNTIHEFAQLSVDQTVEQTLNRSTKTKGGIVGFSLKKNAVQRWILSAHSRALFVDKCRRMTGKKEEDRRHKEAGKSRMKRDKHVRKVMEVVSNWKDPFEPSKELASLSSGCVATETNKLD